MQAAQIRQRFFEFFTARQHQIVLSGSLVPAGDPTLLFTNAGMVQFKRVFQGLEKRDYKRAVTCQKCVRAGGKHNDLEQVGYTARHHTFFEMMGNFSFGDYFKKEAIAYAWEFVTGRDWLAIPPERLHISVHHEDHEARRLWREVTGLADDRIFGLGDADNFWQMGDTGPCGPCSEVYVDLRHKPAGRALTMDEFTALQDADQLMEIWNLVFMQFDQQQGGVRTPLPAPSVDTGAGLERIAAVLQGVPSNYDTDLFAPILRRVADVVGRDYDRGPAGAPFRVLADHGRAVAFLLADGVYPASDGRGYVLRRILRRAVRYAWLLGRTEPTLVQVALATVDQMTDVYPELAARREHIEKITRAEEERFLETIEGGLRRMDELRGTAAISGDEAFKLYDTYGFPLDLTQMIARERGQAVDAEGFEHALGQQRRRSRAARASGIEGKVARPSGGEWIEAKRGKQEWVGYDATRAETDVLAFRQSGDVLELVLKQNPFYAESGGQVSDTGVVKGDGWELLVEDVAKHDGRNAVVGHFGETFEPTAATAEVNEVRRRNIERNHTGTHLVHAALRKILGVHVRQAGSVVAPDRLRFDFSHHGPISHELLSSIEEEVNQHVWENLPIATREMKHAEAVAAGAMALFGEKYGDIVRVVDVPGVSLELCGGTHVRGTGEIGLFRFTHETGAAAGVRRIEAVTGPAAYRHGRELERRLTEAAGLLKAQPEHVAKRIEALLLERNRLQHQLGEQLKRGSTVDERDSTLPLPNDAKLLVRTTEIEDRKQIGTMVDAIRSSHLNTVAVIVSASASHPSVHVGVTDDLIQKGFLAGPIASTISASTGGKGGGRPHFASGGIGDPANVPSTQKLHELVLSYFTFPKSG